MNKKQNNNDIRAGVWMDHQTAHIISRDADGEFKVLTIHAQSDQAGDGSSNKLKSEARKHGRKIELLRKFFKDIQKNLKEFNHIQLTGPTTASAEFHHFLSEVSSFSGKRISEERSSKMSPRQMLAYMKKKLGKPMDIFRSEEVL